MDEVVSSEPKRRLSLTARLTVVSSLIALMTVVILSLTLVTAWSRQLSSYAENSLAQIAQSSANTLAQNYGLAGALNVKAAQSLMPISAITPGTTITVYDTKGNILYDDLTQKLNDSWVDASDYDPTQLLSSHAQIMAGDMVIGSVRVVSLNRESIVPFESEFRSSSYWAIVVGSSIAIIFAGIIGYLLTRDFVRPLYVMTSVAREIERGHLSARTRMVDQDELGILGQTLDVMAEHLQAARQYERQITTDVAHELRTPLMAMQATIEAMIDGVLPSDIDRLSVLNSEVIHMGRLVDAQMRLSKLESRNTQIETEVLDLSHVVADILDIHLMLLQDSGITLATDLEPGVKVLGDSDLLRQALGNLISNSVRYTPENGTISIRVASDSEYAQIEVRDTGIGISTEDIAKVFNKFWRADSGRERSTGGLGIGLAVVKEIADLMNGWVDVSSIEGKGSSFTIVIPLYKEKKKKKKKKIGKKQEV